jgi:DeoR/GlpR family transcriptional regulator of sugar metabolism
MVDIAVLLGRSHRHDVFLAGGRYNDATKTTTSPETFAFLASRVYDLAVLGISAIDLVHGYMGPSDQHVALIHLIRRQSRRLMVVCDATKFDRTDSYSLLAFREVDQIVCDQAPPPAFMQKFKECGTATIFSPATGSPRRRSAPPAGGDVRVTEDG